MAPNVILSGFGIPLKVIKIGTFSMLYAVMLYRLFNIHIKYFHCSFKRNQFLWSGAQRYVHQKSNSPFFTSLPIISFQKHCAAIVSLPSFLPIPYMLCATVKYCKIRNCKYFFFLSLLLLSLLINIQLICTRQLNIIYDQRRTHKHTCVSNL